MKQTRRLWGMAQRRPCWVPTLRGWVVLLAFCASLAVFAVRGIFSFLAVTQPVESDMLVVEGWLPDYALGRVVIEFRRKPYQKMYVTGAPIEAGSFLSEYTNHAFVSAATLLRLGISQNVIEVVPAPKALRDRTYTSGLTLNKWFGEHGVSPKQLQVMTLGPHARRTRLLYEKAMGDRVAIGIIAIEDQDFEPQHWWRTSMGFRSVTDELIAYGYARFLFHPREP